MVLSGILNKSYFLTVYVNKSGNLAVMLSHLPTVIELVCGLMRNNSSVQHLGKKAVYFLKKATANP